MVQKLLKMGESRCTCRDLSDRDEVVRH